MRLLNVLILSLAYLIVEGQVNNIQLLVWDQETRQPIEGVHVFYNQSTDGSFSDAEGKVNLLENASSNRLIVSHIAYELLSIPQIKHQRFQNGDTLRLKPLAINLDMITVKEDRTKTWKKRLKAFSKALLGTNKPGKQAKITNPNVLLFESIDGGFKAVANTYLEVENKYLGYEIHFYLTSAKVMDNGSSSYHGFAKFIDQQPDSDKHQKRRADAYDQSIQKALYSLTRGLEKDRYLAQSVQYQAGQFTKGQEFVQSTSIKYDSMRNKYNIFFNDFLEIEDRQLEKVVDSDFKMSTSGLESQRFNGTLTGGESKVVYAKSQLYKVAPFLIVDTYGNITNQEVVKEYGFWATQKLASALPTNYIKAQITNDIDTGKEEDLNYLRQLIYSSSYKDIDIAIDYLTHHWKSELVIPLLDVMKMSTSQHVVQSIQKLINEKEPMPREINFYNGIKYIWDEGIKPPAYYPNFKAEVYKYVDPNFERYFLNRGESSLIDFEKILWGGVRQDGIPPLRLPKMIDAEDADYLEGENVVFGMVVNGIAKAYPKRIMGWHEFVVDTFGAKTIAGVYCTLCGTMVGYDTEYKGVKYSLGTSGFLYQSNKLMYDSETQSLWNTIEGRPVVGPLINKNIELDVYPVITTTWEKWLEQYPKSTVLSLDTGHKRNYDEGAAYKDYFSSNELMFPVEYVSRILDNKQEVIVVRDKSIAPSGLAFSTRFLQKKRTFQDKESGLLVLSIDQKSYRIYAGVTDKLALSKEGALTDEYGKLWQIEENHIINPEGDMYRRVPTHRSFWFAFHNMNPKGRLIK